MKEWLHMTEGIAVCVEEYSGVHEIIMLFVRPSIIYHLQVLSH